MISKEFKTTVELTDDEIDVLYILLKVGEKRLLEEHPAPPFEYTRKKNLESIRSSLAKVEKAKRESFDHWLIYQEKMEAMRDDDDESEEDCE